MQEIFLSCRAGLGLMKRGIPIFSFTIRLKRFPPPPSLGTHTDERQTDRQGSHEKVPHSYTEMRRRQDGISSWCVGPAQGPTASGRKGRPQSVLPSVYSALHLCVPSVSERRMPTATRLRTGLLSKSHGINRIREAPVFQECMHGVATSSQGTTVPGSVQDSSSVLHWAVHLGAHMSSRT